MNESQVAAVLVGLEVEGHLATLTLNRPKRHNALDQALADALLAAVGEVNANVAMQQEACIPWLRWRRESHDIDEQAAMLPAWEQSYLQLERGRFESAIHGVRISDDISLFRKWTNRRLHKVFVTPRKTFAVALLTPSSDDILFQQQDARRGDLLILPPGQSFDIVTRGRFDVAVATLDERCLPPGVSGACSIFGGGVILRASASTRRLGECMGSILGLRDVGPASQPLSATRQRQLKSQLECDLVECISQPQGAYGVGDAAWHRDPAVIVDAARRLVLAETALHGHMPSVPELASRLSVSVRQLHKLFQTRLGVPPRAYAEQLRLSLARSDLRKASPGTATVAAVAAKWGFWHLGRFASSYRAAFGELPSDTAAGCRSEPVRRARVHDDRAEVCSGGRLGPASGQVGGDVHLGP